MPIYDYHCAKCDREFEVEQRITEDPIKTCPHCRSRKVKRLISQTSFVLKGGGWYSDLYSSSSGKKDDGGDKSESKTDSGETKSDSGDTSATFHYRDSKWIYVMDEAGENKKGRYAVLVQPDGGVASCAAHWVSASASPW